MSGNSSASNSTGVSDTQGLSASQNTSANQQNPWAPQANQLLSMMGQAGQTFSGDQAGGPYSGDYVAGPNQNQWTADANAFNNAGTVGQSSVNGLANTGNALTALGTAGMGSAISGLQGFGSNNNPSSVLATANQFANNPYIGQEVQGAMLGAEQTAGEQTLPNLYRAAGASGNLNSDRTALAQGVVDRGLAQTAAGLTGQLQGQAWNQGLNTATTLSGQQLQALNSLGLLGSSGVSAGTGALGSAINGQGAVSQQQIGAAGQDQQLAQLQDTNALDQYNGSYQYPWQNLNNFKNIVGSNMFGTSSTGTTSASSGTSSSTSSNSTGNTQNNPSLLSSIGQGLGVFGSLFAA